MFKRDAKKKIIIPESYKYISAFLTMRCNLKCSYCLNEISEEFNRKNFQEISGEKWIKGLNKIKSNPEVPITFSGGEPSLHPDFIPIVNNLDQDLNIDILTNLYWSKDFMNNFLSKVDPARLKRDSNYPSIRVSYHPEQMGDGERIVKNAHLLQDKGFDIGIYSVQYPGKKQLEAITQMQFRCLDSGLDFRLKDFTGRFEGKDDAGENFSILYGNYSKYPDSSFQEQTKNCLCKTSELLIGTNGDVYKCHGDVFSEEFSIGNILDDNFQIKDQFRECNKYGQCHPCDVKVKTNYKQELGHTSVEIKDIK